MSVLGPSTVMAEVRRDRCVALRDTFASLPPNFAKKLKGGQTLRELATKQHVGGSTLAYETLEKYLSTFRRFTAWACKEDLFEKDYGADLKPLTRKPDGSMAKLPFEAGELARIFQRPIYVGCQNDEQGFARPGTNIIRRSRYWAPLIALFSGLRAGEILQLTPNHFRVSPSGNPFVVLERIPFSPGHSRRS